MALSPYRSIRDEHGRYARWVARTAGKNGVYVIRSVDPPNLILYVGESHTGNLRETLQRHFQRWNGKTSGPTFFDRPYGVEVALQLIKSGERAVQRQNDLIRRLNPVHNVQMSVAEPKRAAPAKRKKRKGTVPADQDAFDEVADFFDSLVA